MKGESSKGYLSRGGGGGGGGRVSVGSCLWPVVLGKLSGG